MEAIFENNGTIYIVKRLNGETDDYFYEKVRRISVSQPITTTEFIKAQINAQIHCNQKYLGCIYN
jgi:hypothetical protein